MRKLDDGRYAVVLQKRFYLALGMLWLLGSWVALAQQAPPEGYTPLTSVNQVAQAVNAASQEIMLSSELLRSYEVAEALRVALIDRGVSVFVLVPANNVEDPGSYFVSLATIGANVKLSELTGSFLIIDRTAIVSGSLISGVVALPGFETNEQTILVNNANYTAQYVQAFYQNFNAAAAFDMNSFLERNGATLGGQ